MRTIPPANHFQKIFGIGLITFFLPVVAMALVIGYFLFFYEQGAPHLFPLDDPKGRYIIFKSVERTPEGDKPLYWLNYRGKKVIGSEGTDSTFSVMIGESDVELNQFLDSYMTNNVIVKGNFGYSDRQCVLTRCVKIAQANRSVVVNIRQVIP